MAIASRRSCDTPNASDPATPVSEYTEVPTGRFSDALVDGYNQILKTTSIEAYVESAGANGALLFYPKRIRNFREWQKVDIDLWKLYWFGMINQGVMAQPFWWDEQWTISMVHSLADVDKHLTAFEKLAPSIEQMQAESKLQTVS